VFIVGRGRSGTTLLQNILDANENVLMPIESRLIIYLKQKYFKKEKWTKSDILTFIEDIYLDKEFKKYWKIKKGLLREQFLSIPIKKINFNLLCKIIYLNYESPYKKSQIELLGDKNPTYSIFVKDLLEVFPDAKFIHLIRDYRDNVLSNVNVIKTESIPIAAHGWVAYNQEIEKVKEKNPTQFLTIKYEDLVISPDEIAKKICNFLTLDYHPEMLQFNKVIEKKLESKTFESTKEMTDFHPNLIKPINTNQIKKWETAFTKKEVQLIEFIAGDFGKKYGYEKTQPKSTSTRLKIKAFSSLIRHMINYKIITLYYKLPQKLRELMSSFSKFIFKTFKYTNYFNSADF
ncbi:MAG: sulfotransferase, partial [Anaerolineae bacterium]|nr:sulfotransferase [Anaerolineae bacterium]